MSGPCFTRCRFSRRGQISLPARVHADKGATKAGPAELFLPLPREPRARRKTRVDPWTPRLASQSGAERRARSVYFFRGKRRAARGGGSLQMTHVHAPLPPFLSPRETRTDQRASCKKGLATMPSPVKSREDCWDRICFFSFFLSGFAIGQRFFS